MFILKMLLVCLGVRHLGLKHGDVSLTTSKISQSRYISWQHISMEIAVKLDGNLHLQYGQPVVSVETSTQF